VIQNPQGAPYRPPAVADGGGYKSYGIAVWTASNVLLALVPMALIEVKQTITIKASMTAYSTAVGPSSETIKFLTPATNDFNMAILSF
jgi:hypothetical protein